MIREDDGEPEEPEQGACRICGLDWDIGNGIEKDGDICLDYNCWVASGRAKATPAERKAAWRWIIRRLIAGERPIRISRGK